MASSYKVEVGDIMADRGIYVWIILKYFIKKQVRKIYSEFIWLRNETNGELFVTRQMNF
jgi:hypothetical protein